MTDVILSSFISLFALFGKVEQVDEERAKKMLVNYLRHHFGIRNTDLYVDLYSDMRMAYEMTDDLNTVGISVRVLTPPWMTTLSSRSDVSDRVKR